jgi:hypothetical protein
MGDLTDARGIAWDELYGVSEAAEQCTLKSDLDSGVL